MNFVKQLFTYKKQFAHMRAGDVSEQDPQSSN